MLQCNVLLYIQHSLEFSVSELLVHVVCLYGKQVLSSAPGLAENTSIINATMCQECQESHPALKEMLLGTHRNGHYREPDSGTC